MDGSCLHGFCARQAAAIPHVDECNFCSKCHTGNAADSSSSRHLSSDLPSALQALDGPRTTDSSLGGATADGSSRGLAGAAARGETMYIPPGFNFKIMPSEEEIEVKASKPNCTECYGCNTQIKPIRSGPVKAFGVNMMMEVGASPEWLFFAGA